MTPPSTPANARAGNRPRRVALLIELSTTHARGLIRGISGFAEQHGPWSLHLAEPLAALDLPRWLAACPCDGLIARVESPRLAEVVAGLGLPVVSVAGSTVQADWPRVDTDNAAVCTLAAAHLIERGYTSLAYCGMPRYEWSHWRRDYFAAELARQGRSCHMLDLPSLRTGADLAAKDRKALRGWLESLVPPVGILAANDHCGRFVLEACAEAGRAVPDEVGVLGVDNDDVVCGLCRPPLSSIEANCEQIGRVAAETLARLLSGGAAGFRQRLIKPTTLVVRRSTDAVAVGEPLVAEALRFIRAYAASELHSPDVARHVHVSRRYLELEFRRTLGRSIHTEIQRVRLELAQRMLGETDWKLQTIAERSGFKQAAHLSAVFAARLGLRPGEYRRRVQGWDDQG